MEPDNVWNIFRNVYSVSGNISSNVLRYDRVLLENTSIPDLKISHLRNERTK